jgi:glutamine synthetase
MKLSIALSLSAISATSAFAPTSVAPRSSTSLNVLLPKLTGQSALDPSVIARYDALAFPEKILAEYVWVDAVGNTRSKTRTLTPDKADAVENLPKWNFDGSSTDQAPGDDSEVILQPQAIYKDPFRPREDGLRNILVMCDCYTPSGEPIATNTRAIGESYFVLFYIVLYCFVVSSLNQECYYIVCSVEDEELLRHGTRHIVIKGRNH